MIEQFKKDVDTGLSSNPKKLSSKYFYNKKGSELFVKIMHMPEYYVTRAELDIFSNQTQDIIDSLKLKKDTYFELIELGAGDGLKTKKLLNLLVSSGFDFNYFPVDISQNALDNLEESLSKELPSVRIQKKQGDYFNVLESLKGSNHLKVVLFLGSNIGNMTDDVAANFMYELGSNLNAKDRLLLGVDLIKAESVVLPAYNDKQGITRDFNLNLLSRINSELGADFDLKQFSHRPEYSDKDGIARSFIVSDKAQEVVIKSLGKSYFFQKDEKIATEISRKYNDEIVNRIIENTDFTIDTKLTDRNNYFSDYILCRMENKD